MVVAFHVATLTTGRALPLTWTGLSPVGTRQLSWRTEERFTARDLLKTTVLHILHHTDIVSGRPALQAYQERCEARPAFQKALADHLKPFGTATD